ncbi:protein transport protein Sec16A-like [Corticium candelabrum]|uniref:protein transport protein Sec16A-like n=1 Tax=Corticium candelabrum TaxID=121492 RepID=UPI002E267DEE|nr:protein transport protein Sec16A-like [Corticium candelabrum]
MYHDGLPDWLLSLEGIIRQREDHTIRTAEPTPSSLPSLNSSTAAKDQTDGSDMKDEDMKNRKETKQKPGESKQKIKPSGNRMILSDDKKKSIVWDDKLQRWLNQDGTEDETSGPAAPPIDMQLQSQGMLSALGQTNNVDGTERPGPPFPGNEQVGASMPMTSMNAYSRLNSGPRGRQGLRNKYVDVLNLGGNGGSSSHSSIAPPPAVPGIMNLLPSQPFSGTLFVPQSTDNTTGDTLTQQSADGSDQVTQSSEGQMAPLHVGSTTSGLPSASHLHQIPGVYNNSEPTRGSSPDRMSTTSKVSEFSLEVRQHMGYPRPTENTPIHHAGQIPMYSSPGPLPAFSVRVQPQQRGRFGNVRPRYVGMGVSSKPPTTM